MAKAVDVRDKKLKEAYKELTKKDGKTNWILYHFVKGRKLGVAGKGTGGLGELSAQFKADQVMFGAFRVYGVDKKENVTSRRSKILSVTWIGPKVKVMAKARTGVQVPIVMSLFSGLAGSYQVNDLADLTRTIVAKKLLAAGGAHKPTQYEFAPGDVYDIKSGKEIVGKAPAKAEKKEEKKEEPKEEEEEEQVAAAAAPAAAAPAAAAAEEEEEETPAAAAEEEEEETPAAAEEEE